MIYRQNADLDDLRLESVTSKGRSNLCFIIPLLQSSSQFDCEPPFDQRSVGSVYVFSVI